MNTNLVQQELRIYSGDRLYYTCLVGSLLNNSPPVAFSAQGVIVDGVRIENPRVEWVDLDVKLPDISAFFASKKDSKSVVYKRALYLRVDGKFWMFRKRQGISPDAWIPLQYGHSMGDFVGVIPVASPVGVESKGEAVEESDSRFDESFIEILNWVASNPNRQVMFRTGSGGDSVECVMSSRDPDGDPQKKYSCIINLAHGELNVDDQFASYRFCYEIGRSIAQIERSELERGNNSHSPQEQGSPEARTGP